MADDFFSILKSSSTLTLCFASSPGDKYEMWGVKSTFSFDVIQNMQM